MSAEDCSYEEDYQERRPPLWILAVAVIDVAVAFGLFALSDLTSHIVGYLLGSFVCVSVVALFIKVDSARRNSADVVYLEVPGLRYAWSAVLIAGISACVLHALPVASELAART